MINEIGLRSPKGKFNLSLSSASKQRLDNLISSTDADSASEVVKHALYVFDSILNYLRTGNELLVRHPSDAKLRGCQIFYRADLARKTESAAAQPLLAKNDDKALKLRVNLSFSKASKQRLERLIALTEADTASEVVRRALQAYESIVDYIQSGHEILARSSLGGDLKPCDFFYRPQLRSDARLRAPLDSRV